MQGYGQVCLVARAAEVVGERWNLLIVRTLLYGAQNFNSLRKSMTAISPTLLSARLKRLEQMQVIERVDDHGSITYRLTDAGYALRPSVEALAAWATRYTPSTSDNALTDIGHILWEMPRRVDATAFPRNETLAFQFHVEDAKLPRFNLVVAEGVSKIAFKLSKRMAPVLSIKCNLKTLARLWIAEETFDEARRTDDLVVDGDELYYAMLCKGLMLNLFATSSA